MGYLLHQAINLFVILLIVRVISSWIPEPPSPLDKIGAFAVTATEWICGPLRKLLPPVRVGAVAFDLSIIVVFFIAQFAHSLVSFLF